MFKFLKKIVGDSNDRAIKQIMPIADEIESIKDEYQALSDEQLREKTAEFRARLADGETLDDILPDAFATVREAARRQIGQFHYKVQLIGGIVLHEGKIAEMKTGEGKTLVATMPSYLNALRKWDLCAVVHSLHPAPERAGSARGCRRRWPTKSI